MKVITYKGFKIKEGKDEITDNPIFNIYTEEEWSYGSGLRSSEWEAGSLKEAKEFIDSY